MKTYMYAYWGIRSHGDISDMLTKEKDESMELPAAGGHTWPWQRSAYPPIGGHSHQECCLEAL